MPAFTEDFSNGLRSWTIARWRSQQSAGGNAGPVPPSSNDDSHYDGVRGSHTTPTGAGILPPYDIFVGTNNWLYVGGGSQNYGDTFLRCAQKMDLTGSGPWVIRLGFVANLNPDGLLGWSTLYATDLPMASPSMERDNSHGPVPQSGFAIRLDGSTIPDGTSTLRPAPFALTYNNYVETTVTDGISLSAVTTTAVTEVVITFTRSNCTITADGVTWFNRPWTIPTALTSAWMYLGAHNHATRKYTGNFDSRSAIFSHFEFDGTVIPPQYSYAVPDSLTVSNPGEDSGDVGVNVGWFSPTPTLTIPGVPANVSAARLVMSTRWGLPNGADTGSTYAVRYSLNGNTTHDVFSSYLATSGSFSYSPSINVAELVTGNNTLDISLVGQTGGYAPFVGNISLLVESFSTGKLAVGSTILSSLKTGNTSVSHLNIGAVEIWRAPLPPTVPTAPTLISVLVNTTTSLNVRWSQPVSNGSALSDYTVQYRTSPSGSWTTFTHTAQTTRTITVTGLTAGVAYDIRVAAVNGIGTGGWSNVVTQPGANGPPNPPTLTAVSGNTQVVCSWTAAAPNGSAVTNYINEWRLSPAGTWNTFSHTASTALTRTITGLTNGTAYDFKVSAVNGFGTGVASNIATTTPAPPTAPAQVTGLTSTTVGSTTVGLTWTAPGDGGSAITNYLVEYSSNAGSSYSTFTHGSTATATTVTGLTASTAYLFRVSAINTIGTGTASTPLSQTTSAVGTVRPVFRSVSAVTAGATLTLAVPRPTGVVAGDLLLIECHSDTNANMTCPGFTVVGSATYTGASSATRRSNFLWKLATGSEPSTYTVTAGGTAYNEAICMAYIGGSGIGAAGSTNGNFNCATLAVANNNSLEVIAWGFDNASSNNAGPAGWTRRVNGNGTYNAWIAERPASAGTTTSSNFTGVGDTTFGYGSINIILIP